MKAYVTRDKHKAYYVIGPQMPQDGRTQPVLSNEANGQGQGLKTAGGGLNKGHDPQGGRVVQES